MENISIEQLKKTLLESNYNTQKRNEILDSLDDAFKILNYAVRELNQYMDIVGVPKARTNIAFAKTYIEKAKRELL